MKRNLLTGSLLCLLFFSHSGQAAPVAPAGDDASATLGRYQMALDRLAVGRPQEARVILEETIRRYGNTPEINLLLGYLLQKEGRLTAAQDRLLNVAADSPLAAAYATQLAGTEMPAGAAVAQSRTLTRLGQTDARLAKLEQSMIQMVNAERARLGLSQLVLDGKLAEASRAHSAEMRDRNYFEHQSPTASLREPLDRYKAVFPTSPLVVAENIYRAWGGQHQLSDEDVRAGHVALMKSPGHRSNIVYPDVTRIGIGVVTNATGDIWITQMFAR
ncbi:MAG: CAP domain-containing protein [Armatimonadota bacterium]|nr:CAP domain-containing protein [Armatimonadota bacterium]